MADTAYDVVRGWIAAAEATLGAGSTYYLGDVVPGWELIGSRTYMADEVPHRSLHLVVDRAPKSPEGVANFLPVRPRPVHWLWLVVEAAVVSFDTTTTGGLVEDLLLAMSPSDLDAVCAAYAVGGPDAAREVLRTLDLPTVFGTVCAR